MCDPAADPNSKPSTALFCEGYKPLLDSHDESIIRGAFIYEGNPITEPSKPGMACLHVHRLTYRSIDGLEQCSKHANQHLQESSADMKLEMSTLPPAPF